MVEAGTLDEAIRQFKKFVYTNSDSHIQGGDWRVRPHGKKPGRVLLTLYFTLEPQSDDVSEQTEMAVR